MHSIIDEHKKVKRNDNKIVIDISRAQHFCPRWKRKRSTHETKKTHWNFTEVRGFITSSAENKKYNKFLCFSIFLFRNNTEWVFYLWIYSFLFSLFFISPIRRIFGVCEKNIFNDKKLIFFYLHVFNNFQN